MIICGDRAMSKSRLGTLGSDLQQVANWPHSECEQREIAVAGQRIRARQLCRVLLGQPGQRMSVSGAIKT